MTAGKIIALILIALLLLFIVGSVKSIFETLRARRKNKPVQEEKEPEKGDSDK